MITDQLLVDSLLKPHLFYDGTNEIHMKNLIDDVKVLMAEYKKPKKD